MTIIVIQDKREIGARNHLMDIYNPNKTSAKLLIQYAEESIQEESPQKYLMLYDIFIKARSYYLLNKVFFIMALIFGLFVLIWPSLAIFAKDFEIKLNFLNSSIVQTTVTGIAVLTFTVYSHYKKRQKFAENLMRYIIFSNESLESLKDFMIQEMQKMDNGFSFGKNIVNKF
jgi:hypothetical protein